MVQLKPLFFSLLVFCFLELEKLLGKLGHDTQRVEDSVLIGCSEQHEAWFALDLGLNNSSSMSSTQHYSYWEFSDFGISHDSKISEKKIWD